MYLIIVGIRNHASADNPGRALRGATILCHHGPHQGQHSTHLLRRSGQSQSSLQLQRVRVREQTFCGYKSVELLWLRASLLQSITEDRAVECWHADIHGRNVLEIV